MNWTATLHPDDRERYLARWQAAVASGEPYSAEARLRRADGAYEWFLIRSVPHFDQSGRVIKWYGAATNIEDRKRAERLLSGEKRVLEAIAQAVPLPLALEEVCLFAEQMGIGKQASVLIVDADGKHLRHGAAPHLPSAYTAALDGVAIGPGVGSRHGGVSRAPVTPPTF